MINYPLATSTWDEHEYEAIQRVVNSGMFTMGHCVSEYEKRFADFFGTRFALMTSSGSTANLLMIAALFFTKNNKLKLKPGDEIIVPSVSWSTSYFPLQQYGLKVKFLDIDNKTLNLDLAKLEQSITDKTRAIMLVNLLGNPNDFTSIKNIIGDRDILILEDNCESMGAKFENSFTGTFGIMGTFSSFFSHHISTMEGGCVVTDSEELFHILLSLREHGWTRSLPEQNLVTGTKSENSFEESFKFVLPGYNVRPLEISGAIGIEQLKKLGKFLECRKQNGKYFIDCFSDHPIFSIQKEIGQSSWFGFALTVKKNSGLTREKVLNEFSKQGIETRPIVAGNFTKNKVIDFFNYEIPFKLTNADYLHENGLFIGNHHILKKDQIQKISSINFS